MGLKHLLHMRIRKPRCTQQLGAGAGVEPMLLQGLEGLVGGLGCVPILVAIIEDQVKYHPPILCWGVLG